MPKTKWEDIKTTFKISWWDSKFNENGFPSEKLILNFFHSHFKSLLEDIKKEMPTRCPRTGDFEKGFNKSLSQVHQKLDEVISNFK